MTIRFDDTKVSVWLGVMDCATLAAYTEERFNRRDDEAVSDFAADHETTWIDHDWMEVICVPRPTTAQELLGATSYAESWLPSAIEVAGSSPIYTCAIVLVNHSADRGTVGRMRCLGAFDYRR